jgi:hypothetical protein
MGVGDVIHDRAPLQVTQFEADIRIATQLEKIWLEQGGGGNGSESYHLPWYFAAMHTSTDSFEKRGKKGYLFTLGDENPPPELTPAQIEKVFGYKSEAPMATKDIYDAACRQWEIFHLLVEEGNCCSRGSDLVLKNWRDILGERAILLADHKKLAEVIVSLIEVNEGKDASAVSASWGGSTSMVVSRAVSGLSNAVAKNAASGVVRF